MSSNTNFSLLSSLGSKAGTCPSNALSLDSVLEVSTACEPAYNPFDDEFIDYRHFLLVHALPRVIDSELTDIQRRCVRMFYFGGCSEKEIALALGVNQQTVSKHLKNH